MQSKYCARSRVGIVLWYSTTTREVGRPGCMQGGVIMIGFGMASLPSALARSFSG
jgi:hypothetical protein